MIFTSNLFVAGEWVDKYPELVKAIHDAGHEVMSRWLSSAMRRIRNPLEMPGIADSFKIREMPL